MPPVKSQGRANATKQKAEEVKKGNHQKNVRRNCSKVSQPPSKVPNGKQKGRGNVPNLEDEKADDIKSNRRSNTDQGKKRGAEQKPPQKQTGITLRNGKTANGRSQPQPKRDSKSTGRINKTTKLKPPKAPTTKQGRINNKHPAKPENKRSDKVTESEEEESESDAGSSVEATEEESSNDEKEEERDSSKEPTETQESEESSKEEAEVSDTQRDTEQTADEESDKELAEEAKSRSHSEVETATSSEEEVEKGKEVEVSEAVISDRCEDKEITQEDTSEKPTTNKACRRRRQTPRPPKPAQEPKYKMFKKTKADKQAEKAEKQRAKAEKQRKVQIQMRKTRRQNPH
ncbi:caldesmon-like [Thunnus maccoyii]|uniref:caldesmon-like n=1 Tax=Thunnus maccoyii TaxID=8240 RepID=UPI001C4AF82E|nr:caldesmon-like [Thunnus maccoyii]